MTFQQVETGMECQCEHFMVVLSILIFPASKTMNNPVASSLLNNIVETMLKNIVGPTMSLTHDTNVVQTLFRQQSCNNL